MTAEAVGDRPVARETAQRTIDVDGRAITLGADRLAQPLAETLRAAGVTSVKLPCGEGTCGGCTVLLDGAPVAACVTPSARAAGLRVRTAASVTAAGPGATLAAELARRGALQCGFCIPGIVCSSAALLEQRGDLDAATVRAALAGHLCRCTGYEGIVDAVLRAAAGTPGAAATRQDGRGKADGSLRYSADQVPDALVGLLLTSRGPHAHVTVEPGDALDVPGAVAVFGPGDAPARRFCTNPHVDDPVLAPAENAVFAAEARYVGDIVGLVVAETAHAAREMAARVRQVEEPLPAARTVAEALADGAARVQRARTDLPGNVAVELAFGADEAAVSAALAAAPVTHTSTVEILPGPIAALERPAALATWDDGRCTVWSTSQTPQVVRRRLAGLLGLDAATVDLRPVPLGGGFGLKEEMFLEPAAALASRGCGGRPVRVEPTRAQLGRLRRRHAGTITITSGCAEDGAVLARDVRVVLDAGGEVGHSGLVLENLLLLATSLYPVAVGRAAGRAVLTNTTSSAAFRGYGASEITFALETHLDDLARRFGSDPVEFRRRHVLRAGQVDPVNSWVVASLAVDECLDALAAAGDATAALPPGQTAAGEEPGRWRRGSGMSMFAIVTAASSAVHKDSARARCRVGAAGIVVETVVPDMGQGIHSTLAAVAAEQLGLPAERVVLCQAAAAAAPADEGTFASRGVYLTGNAVAEAAHRLTAAAEHRLGWPGGTLRWTNDGAIRADAVDAPAVPWSELVGLVAEAGVIAEDNGLVVGAQRVDVAVDAWTGRLRVERVVSVHDVGRVLEPALARGQVVGGVLQGIGVATTEQARHDGGVPLDVHLFDQAIPTMALAPEIQAVFVGDGAARGRLGAKGLGEAPMVGVPAAIANAVRDATGVRLTTWPMTPERVLAALEDPARSPSRAANAPAPP
ncbi:putative Xanthine dehydrogenase molybdenum-binding subunit [Frankia canadensis]|uniref:Putative Xanthine dehydrogenase molybdenum-binding subunit n=1 Tax=Frankia canadensis TaxID=1836972 RepID=A0A2I2KID8_9ACTN|nr:molybdopterin cofactor-binding domain-containing protein [Frankia canadensis]SNQ45426.1 putative Xanthine dehydrogenase molybdenum-binding subunit [Frankia canadensis]SOU52716.1 putative Xanthine dehydrogenase molybdenum-binding subunit [Frankia canadensis]